jgi:hypothetical protein
MIAALSSSVVVWIAAHERPALLRDSVDARLAGARVRGEILVVEHNPSLAPEPAG